MEKFVLVDQTVFHVTVIDSCLATSIKDAYEVFFHRGLAVSLSDVMSEADYLYEFGEESADSFEGRGDQALQLAEECAEVIQIITKMKRFGGNWDEKRPGKDLTRWQELETEMYDLLNCWQRLRNEVQPAILEVSHWDEDETDKH